MEKIRKSHFKKFSPIVILLVCLLLMQGCSQNVSKQKTDKTPNTNVTSNAIQEKTEPIIYDNAQIQGIFMLHKDELAKKYGNDYKKMQIGPENYYEGYYYKKLGLTFGFDDKLEYIECDNGVWVDGIKNGMGFKEIQQKLGVAEVGKDDTGEFAEDIYRTGYDFDGYDVLIEANDKEGSNSKISILRDVKPVETTEDNMREYFSMNENEFLAKMKDNYYDIVTDAGIGRNQKGYDIEKLSLAFVFNKSGELESVEPRYTFYFKGKQIEQSFESVESGLGKPDIDQIVDKEKGIREILYNFNGFVIKCVSANDNSPICMIFFCKT